MVLWLLLITRTAAIANETVIIINGTMAVSYDNSRIRMMLCYYTVIQFKWTAFGWRVICLMVIHTVVRKRCGQARSGTVKHSEAQSSTVRQVEATTKVAQQWRITNFFCEKIIGRSRHSDTHTIERVARNPKKQCTNTEQILIFFYCSFEEEKNVEEFHNLFTL